jgi:hypothetical protein
MKSYIVRFEKQDLIVRAETPTLAEREVLWYLLEGKETGQSMFTYPLEVLRKLYEEAVESTGEGHLFGKLRYVSNILN